LLKEAKEMRGRRGEVLSIFVLRKGWQSKGRKVEGKGEEAQALVEG